MNSITEHKPKKILNLGCGSDMYGTDRVDLFKTPATTLVLNIDKENLPYKDNTFDEILASGVIEHLKNIGHFEEEVFRVLKKNGTLKILTDSATYIFWHTRKKWEHNNYLKHYYNIDNFKHNQGEDSHLHLFVESHLRSLFRRFSKIEINYIAHGRNAILRFVANSLPFNFGKRQIILTAIK